MSKSRCLLALVFLGSIALVPVTSWANVSDPFVPSICDAVAGNLVKNCGFETGNIKDWMVSGSVVGVSSGAEHSGHFGALFATLEGSIFQVLSTTAGRPFHLTFFLANEFRGPLGEADFSASWDGTKVFSAPIGAFGFTKFSFVLPGHGSDTLHFTGRNHTGFYSLDDVVVTPTPEPSTLSLFGLGLLFGAALLWRKKKLLNGVQS